MKHKAFSLREEIEKQQRKLLDLQSQLKFAECRKHVWGTAERYDKVIPGYQDPGDLPGTMGVDWRGPMYIPEQRIKRWKRTCTVCGYSEITEGIKTHTIEEPNFYDR